MQKIRPAHYGSKNDTKKIIQNIRFKVKIKVEEFGVQPYLVILNDNGILRVRRGRG